MSLEENGLVPLRSVLRRRIFQVCCCCITLIISGVAFNGYAFNRPAGQTWTEPRMAMNTALCLFLLALDRVIELVRKIRRRSP